MENGNGAPLPLPLFEISDQEQDGSFSSDQEIKPLFLHLLNGNGEWERRSAPAPVLRDQ